MKINVKIIFLISLIVFLGNVSVLKAVDIMKILEGYGRDSIATFSTQHAQSEAASIFNLLLESNGEITVEKSEEYLNDSGSPVMKSYLAVILADYAFVNYNFDSGLRYLKRAVDEYDPIRNDSYYRLVLARAQKTILESSGKTEANKESVLNDYSPRAFSKEPTIKRVAIKTVKEPKTSVPRSEDIPLLVKPLEISESEGSNTTKLQNKIEDKPEVKISSAQINYRMQIGAFGVEENALRKQAFFEEQGYPVHIDIRGNLNKPLYIVQLGEFETYEEAKSSLSRFKSNYPDEEGIVIKVKK